MDKIDKLLDLIENASGYSQNEIDELMADPEMRALYEGLSAASGAFHADARNTDDKTIGEEWRKFSRRHYHPRWRVAWSSRRAAAITGIAVASIVAVAAGIGLALKDSSGPNAVISQDPVPAKMADEAASDSTSLTVAGEPATIPPKVEFENETLENIIGSIARTHGLEVKFLTPSAKSLRLYFVWETGSPVEETIGRLDNFERFDVSLNNGVVEVR